jgi:hypothetical protein
MKNTLTFLAVSLLTALVIAGFWTSFLGAKGMESFWTCMLCAMTLAFAFRGSILSSPWAITCGIFFAGFLLGIPAKVMPSSNPGFGFMSQSGGLNLVEAGKISNVALYGTVLVFLVYVIVEWVSTSAKNAKSPQPSQTP